MSSAIAPNPELHELAMRANLCAIWDGIGTSTESLPFPVDIIHFSAVKFLIRLSRSASSTVFLLLREHPQHREAADLLAEYATPKPDGNCKLSVGAVFVNHRLDVDRLICTT
jgi:hypothetical protein